MQSSVIHTDSLPASDHDFCVADPAALTFDSELVFAIRWLAAPCSALGPSPGRDLGAATPVYPV